MGILKAIKTSLSDTMANQWKELISCDAFLQGEVMKPGIRRVSSASTNRKGNPDVISDGSIILVGPAECAIATENFKVIGLYEEAGEHIFSTRKAPSVFNKGSLSSIVNSSIERIGFGGDIPITHKIFYISTREIFGFNFSSAGSIPCRIINENINADIDMRVKCCGCYSIKIANPLTFYKNVSASAGGTFYINQIADQMESEILSVIQKTFSQITPKEGIRPYQLPEIVNSLCDKLSTELTAKWMPIRGISVNSLGIESLTLVSEDYSVIKQLESDAVLTNPSMAAATLSQAQAEALTAAARR